MKRILIVEDDDILNKTLAYNLTAEGYIVDSAGCISEAEQDLLNYSYHLMVLDVNLPDGSGYDLCKRIKEQEWDMPVIFLTANDMESDMIRGYETGASDYVTKPFMISVFLKKVKAFLGLMEKKERNHDGFDDGNLKIDFGSMSAFWKERPVNFTSLEMRMITILIKNKGVLMTRQKLLEKLWDVKEKYVDEHTLTTTISRIRNKIGDGYIETVYGMGYMWTGDKKKEE